MPGWVYIITNEAIPGLVKVGYTEPAPEMRATELAGTGIPTAYVVAFQLRVTNPREVERNTHGLLAPYRAGREWFRCSVEQARCVLEACAGAQQDPGSPLVPGHALSEFFINAAGGRAPVKVRNCKLDGADSPIPPGHPLHGLI